MDGHSALLPGGSVTSRSFWKEDLPVPLVLSHQCLLLLLHMVSRGGGQFPLGHFCWFFPWPYISCKTQHKETQS